MFACACVGSGACEGVRSGGCQTGTGDGSSWENRDTDGVIGFGLGAEFGEQIGCGWSSDFAHRAERRQGWILVRTDLSAQGCPPNQAGCQPEVDACASNPCSRYSEEGTDSCTDAVDATLAQKTGDLSGGHDLPILQPGYTCNCNEGWTGTHCVSLQGCVYPNRIPVQ